MTANPDSALRQALESARDALVPFVTVAGHWDLTPRSRGEAAEHWIIYESNNSLQTETLTLADLRRAREAHALITEALAQSQDKP